MASTYLQKTGITGSSETAWTISCWVKYTGTSESSIYSAINGSNFSEAYFYTDNTLEWYSYSGGPVYVGRIRTNRVFRDKNAWYHLTFVWDSNNGTASDRMRLYVNGIRETSFSLETQPSSGASGYINGTFNVGSFRDQTASYMFNGLMTHYHFIDGTAYDASAFGETDATTGIWKPKTAPSVTYGTNGFFLKFENSGSMGTDSSGNANNFTVNGTPTQTVDTPSNVFATMNAIDNYYTGGTFTNGNNTVQMTNQPAHLTATMGVSSGKYYWEAKMSAGNNSAEYNIIGVAPNVTDQSGYSGALGATNHGVGLRGNGNVWYNEGTAETGWNSWNQGDIVMIALDLDNSKIFWGTNGTWGKSSDPVTGTNGFSISGKEGSKSSGFWFPASCCREISQTNTFQYNFGNGYFGTTAVASGNADDNGLGIFEYAPPTGYLALCTKNINEQEYS